ncbi:MAG: 23S rRNA (pseudouridine(1915)-N(3))-methyltransferase RlmH [Acholeplasmataceae bacterium]|nr:23S rRNA (pseudouridine(1915)-N(3))-methyltransferase RlmH [Acholeplasmataceae bacterium]
MIRILCVGKLQKSLFEKAIAHYEKQIPVPLSWVEVKDEKDQQGISIEGERLLSRIKETDLVIVLAIEGKPLSSEGFSKVIDDWMSYQRGDLVFVIGGSYGLSGHVMARADLSLSFSKMTFPHQMMRLILIEQVYRGFQIIKGHPYHK